MVWQLLRQLFVYIYWAKHFGGKTLLLLLSLLWVSSSSSSFRCWDVRYTSNFCAMTLWYIRGVYTLHIYLCKPSKVNKTCLLTFHKTYANILCFNPHWLIKGIYLMLILQLNFRATSWPRKSRLSHRALYHSHTNPKTQYFPHALSHLGDPFRWVPQGNCNNLGQINIVTCLIYLTLIQLIKVTYTSFFITYRARRQPLPWQ